MGTRVDAACGIVAAAGLWPHQKKKKSKPSDLMPKWGKRRKKVSGVALMAWATAHGATVPPDLAKVLHGD